MKSFPLTQADFYKLSHKKFMHEGTSFLYANFTPRSGRYAKWLDDGEQDVVFFGLQAFIQDFLIDEFNHEFFNKPQDEVIKKFERRCNTSLGEGSISMDHFISLHDLGYLPIEIKALLEGSKVGMKVPVLTMYNTHPDFAWLVTYLETVLSSELWQPITSATSAYQYKKLCDEYADITVGNRAHVMFQCHDFSARGMAGRHAGAMSGAGHLLSFNGTDTVAAIDLVEDYYFANAETEFIAASVPASEHSVTSLGSSVDGEFETIKRWITEDYPTGIVSIVSDTYDYFNVLTNYLPALKEDILARKPNALGLSKVVVRPDSGDPADIICGIKHVILDDLDGDSAKNFFYGVRNGYKNPKCVIFEGKAYTYEFDTYEEYDGSEHCSSVVLKEEISEAAVKGSIELLWEIFGGVVNEKGYKELDSHIGLIYGDSITLERAKEIFERLAEKGFASSNVVFGVGSFTYQMVSRDTLGMAVKATYAVVDGKGKELFKDPVTDNGTKKSARGLLRVEKENGKFVLYDQQTQNQEKQGELRVVFSNSKLIEKQTLTEIRERVNS